jgi:hypothetical protein
MKIEILYIEGCPNHEPTERLVRDVLREVGRVAYVTLVRVEDDEAAERLGFRGSPTVRIDGRDVAPLPDDAPFAAQCRLYRTAGGLSGVPDRPVLRAAILEG